MKEDQRHLKHVLDYAQGAYRRGAKAGFTIGITAGFTMGMLINMFIEYLLK